MENVVCGAQIVWEYARVYADMERRPKNKNDMKNILDPVKVSIRIHNMNTDRLIYDWVLHRWPVNVFSVLGSGPGSLQPETWRKGLTPHCATEWASAKSCGGHIRSVSRLTFLLASKTTSVDDALYFILNSAHMKAYRGRFCLPNSGIIRHCRISPALVETCK